MDKTWNTISYVQPCPKRRFPPSHTFNAASMNNTNLGKLGLCSCPGLLNTRPSRSSKTIQGNPTTDVAHLSAQGVTDVFVVCCFWEITHYNGWTNSEYCTALQNHGITVHWYEVQEAKAPSLEVSWSILKRSGLDVWIKSPLTWFSFSCCFAHRCVWKFTKISPSV